MSQSITVREAVSSGYWHEEEARAVVAAWRASGERLAVFARRHSVQPRRLARWHRRLIDAGDLALLLEGVDLRGAIRRRRWHRLPPR